MTSSLAGDWWRNAVEAAADKTGAHEPFAGGHHCSCQPSDDDGRHEPLPVDWDVHLAHVAVAASLPVVLAELTRRIDEKRGPDYGAYDSYVKGRNSGLAAALSIVAGLAGEADTT